MSRINAFATPAYPVLFSVLEGRDRESRVPAGQAEISIALLVDGLPSYLATHRVPAERMNAVVTSLESGDARVAVVGLTVAVEDDLPSLDLRAGDERPAAFVSLVCRDGRRLTIARILGRERGRGPDGLARHVVREIGRGVQITELASAG